MSNVSCQSEFVHREFRRPRVGFKKIEFLVLGSFLEHICFERKLAQRNISRYRVLYLLTYDVFTGMLTITLKDIPFFCCTLKTHIASSMSLSDLRSGMRFSHHDRSVLYFQQFFSSLGLWINHDQ